MKMLLLFAALLAVAAAPQEIASGDFTFPAVTIKARGCADTYTMNDVRIKPLSKQETEATHGYKIDVLPQSAIPDGLFFIKWNEDYQIHLQQCNSTTADLKLAALTVTWKVSK